MFVAAVLFSVAIRAPAGGDVALTGRIVDQSGLALAGVTVTLTPSSGAPRVDTTDGDGRFHIDAPAGTYSLAAELSGFERATRELVVEGAPVTIDLIMRIAALTDQVSVTASEEPVLGDSGPGAPAVVTREVIDNAMLPNTAVFDVLPLLPNVVRGPDGLIAIAGARAPQGQLLIDGMSQNDPVLGDASLMLPLVPVESVRVLSRGYSSEFGRATGGVTEIDMHVPTDRFRFNIQSFAPRPHFANGGLRGIEAFEPNFGASGPLVKERLWLTQGLDYRWERYSFDTRFGREESRSSAILSWTDVDAVASPSHRISTWLSIDPQNTDHAGISAFTPVAALPAMHRGGWRGAVVERSIFTAGSTLESGVQIARLRNEVSPAGDQPYVVGHDLVDGSYFNTQRRTASRVEISEKWTVAALAFAGSHIVKVGGNFDTVAFDGVNASRRVDLLRSDGSLARRIDFIGPAATSASGYEAAVFVQDIWTPVSQMTIDLGARYDAASVVGRRIVAPRLGAAWKTDAHTTIAGGIGTYSDKVLLAASAFPSFQSRVVTEFEPSGSGPGFSRAYANRFDGELAMPGARAWHVQVDRRFEHGIVARIAYQEQHGFDEPTIGVDETPAQEALVLRSDGTSRARSLETTFGYRSSPGRHSLYVSYVRLESRGNLNDFVSIEGTMKEPFVQRDEVGPLAADVPHRLLAWSLIRLPSRITVAPFLEIRSGFPYSPIDDEWRHAGARNSGRFPTFASLDLFVNKVVKLPGTLPHARIGLKCFNLTGANDARDVQRDVTRPDYGTLYNPLLRQIRGSFELLWGEK